MKKATCIAISCVLAGVLVGAPVAAAALDAFPAEAAVYSENEYMKRLELPEEENWNEKDWKQTTVDFLTYMLDETHHYTGQGRDMKIARYSNSNNAKAYFQSIGKPEEAPEDIWSLPTYIGMGSDSDTGEGLTVLGALVSGALAGMDLTHYECSDGKTRNFVKSAVEYYQFVNGEHVVLNRMGTQTGVTFWYELLPGVLFSVLGMQYESESWYMYDIITESARQWQKAVVGMGGANADFWHTSYKFATGTPIDGNWYEPDAAAGTAYLLYAAYSLNKGLKDAGKEPYATDEEMQSFLQAATWSMNYLERLDKSPFYEVLTFLAPYVAARMNAEQGTNYNVGKMMGWLMDGSSAVRAGWGLVTENWGDKYTNGLMGSLTDGDGYAFAMNTFDAMLGFGPMVKYDTRFARDVSRWVLCASQSAQNYYPSEYEIEGQEDTIGSHTVYHGKYQSGCDYAKDSPEASFIAYEGLRRYRRYVTWDDSGARTTAWDRTVTPYASGDAFTFDWGGITDYGLYGSAHVGLFGGTIEYTDVPMIVRTDLNKLDVFSAGSIPFFMYYNPYDTAKEVSVSVDAGVRLYDTVEKQYVEVKNGKITIPADTTFVLAEIPAGKEVVKNGSDYTCDGEFIAQERGYIELSLYEDESCTQKIPSGSSVEGTIYGKLKAEVPEGAEVQSITLEHGGVSLYSGKTTPASAIVIDTTALKNGNGVMTATLTLAGGKTEKSVVNLQVLNIVKTPALSYGSIADMVSTWTAETAAWNAEHPLSDHTSSIKASADGGFTVTVESPKEYGFVTSELFALDFSRGPMIEFTATEVSAKFAVKIYVDGMEVHNNYTGAYILRDTSETGSFTLDILEEILKEDRSFNLTGAHKASVKISPVGPVGSTVTIKDLNVYHMYTTPVLDEPDEYEWGHDFTSEWLSLWSGSESGGGAGNAALEYTQEGSVIVRPSAEESGYYGVASPEITVAFDMNPVLEVSLKSLKGNYFVAVRFDGDPTLYILADNRSGSGETVEVMSALKARYPEDAENFTGTVRMRVVIGVMAGGEGEFSEVYTYYKLPGWGVEGDGKTIVGDAWLDWVGATGMTANANAVLANNRYTVTNAAPAGNETATAGMQGKFSLNLDYNPVFTMRVRNLSSKGSYRFSIAPFDGGQPIRLTEWKTEIGSVTVNVREAVDGALRGQQNIWFILEVRGGGNYVAVDRMETRYEAVRPDFQTGATLGEEIASWNKDPVNPSKVAVTQHGVAISENAIDSKGLSTGELTVSADALPYIVVEVYSLSEGSLWYLDAKIGAAVYHLLGEGSDETGRVEIDLVAALKAAGYEAQGDIVADYELGASGAGFILEVASIRFVRRLAVPSSVQLSETENSLSWNAVDGAEGYHVRIEGADGSVLAEDTVQSPAYSLKALSLETGVYRAYISAYGAGRLDSAELRYSFKQGDIESVKLATPQNLRLEGMRIVWDEVEDLEFYLVTLYDADENKTLFTGELGTAYYDLTALGLPAFNYRVTVQAKGDGAVYLDGDVAEYAFYTNVVENYNARKFASMSATANQAYAEYDEAADVASVKIPYTNWGGIVSLTTAVSFDRSPVLSVTFAAGCAGGYYLQIVIDGVTYYLADNTFTIHANAAPVTIYVDICGVLASRKDGPGRELTGTHNVAIVFGATSDGFAGVDTPVVRIASAQLIEMTKGSGVKRLGTLSAPVVTVEGKTAKWQAVEHAESYTVVVSNELGVLLTTSVTETSYDLGVFLREGEYTVQVTAVAADYYSSDTGSATYTVKEEPAPEKPKKKGCFGSIEGAAGSGVAAAAALAFAAALVIRRNRKEEE